MFDLRYVHIMFKFGLGSLVATFLELAAHTFEHMFSL